MKFGTALIAAVLFAAGPVLAQAPAGETQPQKPATQNELPARVQPVQPQVPAPIPAAEKVDPAKDAAIRHLMEVTDMSKLGDHLSSAITLNVRNVMSRTLPADRLQKFMEAFAQKFNAQSPSSKAMDAVIPIYAQNFSIEDLQGLIQFYESPLGQRLVKVMPQVHKESDSVSEKIEEKEAIGVLRTMAVDYPELNRLLPPEEAKPGTAPAPAPAPEPAPKLAPPLH
jgi:hypothetical protein